MAESYRGLTIRIGGDTTKLTQALRAANGAIAGTQQELRKLNQALKLDPGNFELINSQMGYMSNLATDTAMRLAQLRDAQQDVGSRQLTVMIDGEEITKTLAELNELSKASDVIEGSIGNAFKDAAQETAKANATLNSYRDTLASMHNEVSELASQMAASTTQSLRETLDLSNGIPSIEQVKSLFDNLPSSVEHSEKEVKKLIDVLGQIDEKSAKPKAALDDVMKSWDEQLDGMTASFARVRKMMQEDLSSQLSGSSTPFGIERIQEVYSQGMEKIEAANKSAADSINDNMSKAYSDAKKAAEDSVSGMTAALADAIEKATELKGVKFTFDNNNTDIKAIEDALAEMGDTLDLNDESVQAFLSHLRDMQGGFGAAQKALRDAQLVQEFQDLLVEIQKGEASLKNLSQAMADMRMPSQLMQSMSELSSHIDVLAKAYQSAMGMGASLEKSFGSNPDNIAAMEAAMREYSAASAIAAESTALMQERIDALEADGITHVSASASSLAENLYQTSVAAQEAKRNLAEAEGEVAHLENTIGILEGKGIPTDQIISVDSIQELTKEETQAIARTEAIGKSIQDLSARLADARARVDELKDAEAKASNEQQLAKKQSEYQRLTSEIAKQRSALEEALEAERRLANAAAVNDAFGDTSNIDNLGKSLDSAIERAKAFRNALKVDPGNMELLRAKTAAYNEVASISKQRVTEIRQALSGFDLSKIDEMRAKYGSVSDAIKATGTAFTAYQSQLKVAESELDKLLKDNGMDGMREDVIQTAGAFDSNLTPEIRECASAVEILRDKASQAKAELGDAAASGMAESMQKQIADTVSKAKIDNKTLDSAAYMQAVSQIGQYAERMGREVVESANTIDSAYRDMRKTVNGVESDFENLRKSAIEFSQTHAVSADTILEIESYGGQLGVAVEHLEAFGNAVSNIAIATDITAEDMALQLGQMTNIMSDMDYSSFDGFADALVRLGNNTATTESMIMNVAQRMAAVANVTSMTTPQLLAWSAAIASTGQRSESAATAINKTITGIGAAVTQGGETLQQFAQIAGMSADDFKSAWENSSSDALEAFVKGLSNLTDSSTDAIAALDSVGISSVRQETALLALSQTVGNLDNSMTMAVDAWNHVGDGFGKAGDAAREAQQKSEGFSGALAILQNNINVLAASLGDALVEPMKLASAAIGLVSDVLDHMGGPLKAVIVSVGGLGVAVGAIYPVLQQFMKGWRDIASTNGVVNAMAMLKSVVEKLKDALGITAAEAAFTEASLGKVGASAGAATAGLTATTAATAGTATGMGVATVATNLFSAALKAIPGVAVVAAITAAFSMLTEFIGDATSRMDLMNKAAASYTDAATAMGNAYSAAVAEMDAKPVAQSLDEMQSETNAMLQQFAEFGDHIKSTFEEAGTSKALVEEYADTINRLGNQGSLTEDQLAELRNAISEYNNITGSAISMTNEETGALNLNASQIDEVTAAWERQAEAKAYTDIYNESIKKRIEYQNDLKQAIAELEEMEKKYGVSLGDIGTLMLWNVDESRELQDRINAINGQIDRVNSTISDCESHMSGAADSTMSFEAAMASAGMSIDGFSDLTDEEKRKLAEIQSALMAAGDSLRNYGNLNAVQLAQIAAAWNGSVADIKKSIKAIKDATSEAAGATPTTAKPDDSAVRERKNQLEAIYTAAKRETEDYYNDEKKKRDRDYDDQKRALDKAYNQRKKELDAEYDAAKKASDSYLKDFKKAQDETVDAYKEATDARLKELEREYDAKKDMLDLEYQAYDDQISERIQAIKDEQAAEDKALKMRERAEKLAELGKAVESAKTPKAFEEANKALQDYKDQLTREDLKEQRNARIAAYEEERKDLKKQLSQRQEHLKETYDAAVEGYKAEREAKLKILQETNEAEYESQKALEEAKLNNIKASHEAELEMQKEANELYLQGIKDQHEAELLDIKRRNEDRLTNIKNQQEAELAAYKEGGEAAVAALNGVEAEVNATADSVETRLTGMAQKLWNDEQKLGGALRGDTKITAETIRRDTEETFNRLKANSNNAVYSVIGDTTSMRQSVETEVNGMKASVTATGGLMFHGLASGMAEGGKEALRVSNDVASGVGQPLADTGDRTWNWGWDMLANFGSGAVAAWNNGVGKTFNDIANFIVNMFKHSRPKSGPFKDDHLWFYHMMENLAQGAERGAPLVYRQMDSIASEVAYLGTGMTDEILQSMRDREIDLAAQAERLARIVEDGFDPRLSLESAYQAMDRIDAATLRRQQTIAASSNTTNDNRSFNITISIPEVVVREEADIDRLSQQIALRVQRSINARIG